MRRAALPALRHLPIIAATAFAVLLLLLVPREPNSASSWWLSFHTPDVRTLDVVKAATASVEFQPINLAFWSLRWEVAFPLLLPLFLLLVRLTLAYAVAAAAVLAVLVPVGLIYQIGALTYLPLFGIGVIAAAHLGRLDDLGIRFDATPGFFRGGVIAAAVLLVPVSSWAHLSPWGFRSQQLAYLPTVAGVCLLVWLFACTSAGRTAGTWTGVGWLGRRSFSLYLVHEPIVVTTAYLFGGRPDPYPILFIALPVSLVAAELFGLLIEGPAHRFSQRVGSRLGTPVGSRRFRRTLHDPAEPAPTTTRPLRRPHEGAGGVRAAARWSPFLYDLNVIGTAWLRSTPLVAGGPRLGTVPLVDRLEQESVETPDGTLFIEVRSSGVIRWSYDGGSGDAGGVALVLLLAAFLVNCIGRLVFRGGSTLWVTDPKNKRKLRRRFRGRAAAMGAALALIPALAADGLAAFDGDR